MNKIITLSLISILLLVSGCSPFTRPMEQPVIEEKLNKSIFSPADVGTLSLTPERRIVLANFKTKRFCAEAPTEVSSDMSRLLKIASDAGKGEELRASLEAISATASSNSVLNKRTQGMQLFLANAYFLCQMYMNEAIKSHDLIELQLRTLNAVAPLIEKEIILMYENDTEKETEDKKFIPLDINKTLEEVNKRSSPPKEP